MKDLVRDAHPVLKGNALVKEVQTNVSSEFWQLEEELAMTAGEQRTDELSEDLIRCEQAVKVYLEDFNPNAIVSVGTDMRKVHSCFRIMKKKVLEKQATSQKTVAPIRPVPRVLPLTQVPVITRRMRG